MVRNFKPGPGTYTPRDSIKDVGNYANSKYKNEGNVKMMSTSI